MKYLVIGLGNLGRAIAESLTRIGNEVIGVDINPHKTEAVKHTISGAISLDTTDKDALNTLPLNEMVPSSSPSARTSGPPYRL